MKSKLELKEESGEVKKKKAWKKPTLEVVGNGDTLISGKNTFFPLEFTGDSQGPS